MPCRMPSSEATEPHAQTVRAIAGVPRLPVDPPATAEHPQLEVPPAPRSHHGAASSVDAGAATSQRDVAAGCDDDARPHSMTGSAAEPDRGAAACTTADAGRGVCSTALTTRTAPAGTAPRIDPGVVNGRSPPPSCELQTAECSASGAG
eukprot:4591332-Prymnesium_polylepis.1